MDNNLLEVKTLVDDKVIKETLNRVGVANKKEKVLYPSCYLWENDGKKYLVHFKQLFLLTRDSAYNNICEDDVLRRNAIAFCLKNWGLIEVADESIEPHNKYIFVLPYNQKKDWKVNHKFNFRSLNIINTSKEPSNG